MPQRAGAVEIGDKAPALDRLTWISGDAVQPDKPDGKTVYVVEFWATWCAPCRTTIPHLGELQKKFGPKGVVFVGISDEEESVIKNFMKEVKMDYRIATDPKKTIADTWRKTVEGIPHAFVVDSKGMIVWQGHPMDGLEGVLDDILAGSFDPHAAQAREAASEKLMRLLADNNYDEAMKLLEEELAKNPKDLDFRQVKAGLLMSSGDSEEFQKELAALRDLQKDSAEGLNELAWGIAQPSALPFKFIDPVFMIETARQAVELTHGADAATLDTLAHAYYRSGMIEEAIAAEEGAIKLMTPETQDEATDMRDMLNFLKRARAARAHFRAAAESTAPVQVVLPPAQSPLNTDGTASAESPAVGKEH